MNRSPHGAALPWLALLLAVLASPLFLHAEQPSIQPAFPGKELGNTETRWIAPHVLQVTSSTRGYPGAGVWWFDADGNVIKELAPRSESSSSYSCSGEFLLETLGPEAHPQTIIHGLSNPWKVTLPPPSYPHRFGSFVDCHGDTLIRRYHTDAQHTRLEVYVKGRRTGEAGPFADGRFDTAWLNAEGYTALLVARDGVAAQEQVVLLGPDARERLRLDIPYAMQAWPTGDGHGVIVTLEAQGNQPSMNLYVRDDGLEVVLDQDFPVCNVPGTDRILYRNETPPGNYLLVEAATGKVLWQAEPPVRSSPQHFKTAVANTGHILIVGTDVAVLDAQTGAVQGIWKSDWTPLRSTPPQGNIYRKDDDLFILTNNQFFKIDFDDVAAHRNGWE